MNMQVRASVFGGRPEIFSFVDIEVNYRCSFARLGNVIDCANLYGRMTRIIGTMPSLTMSSVPFLLSRRAKA
jgi:hypothetical protein